MLKRPAPRKTLGISKSMGAIPARVTSAAKKIGVTGKTARLPEKMGKPMKKI